VAETILCDTTIVSILLKVSKVHDHRKAAITKGLNGKIPLISFVTVAELVFWSNKNGWGQKKKDEMEKQLRAFGILTPTRATSDLWAEIKLECQRAGCDMSKKQNDLWIAASAREFGLSLASDDADFDGVQGLTRISL
jgi:predicted nucleic acid-binding protein